MDKKRIALFALAVLLVLVLVLILTKEDIEMKIVKGEVDEVPAEIGKSKRLVIREYLYECSQIQDIDKRLECFEVYYLNNDQSLRQKKEDCDSTQCLDEYYLLMAQQKDADFCQAIQDQQIKSQCMEIG